MALARDTYPSRTIVFILFAVSVGIASPSSSASNDNPGIGADEFVRQVVENELHAQDGDKSQWRFRELKEQDGKKELLEVVKTNEGEIHRLVAVNGRPLTEKQRSSEDSRIEKLLADDSEFHERQRKRKEDADKEEKMLKIFPEAFRFRYEGSQDGCIRIAFTPNPEFHPSSREAAVFSHMQGILMVNLAEKRLAGIEGQLTSEVKFADGLLGHLDPGGTFCVRQREVGPKHWEMTELDVRMKGKALLFKTIAVQEKETYTDFQQVLGSISLEQAAELLEKQTAS